MCVCVCVCVCDRTKEKRKLPEALPELTSHFSSSSSFGENSMFPVKPNVSPLLQKTKDFVGRGAQATSYIPICKRAERSLRRDTISVAESPQSCIACLTCL